MENKDHIEVEAEVAPSEVMKWVVIDHSEVEEMVILEVEKKVHLSEIEKKVVN